MRWLPLGTAARELGIPRKTLDKRGQRGSWERRRDDVTGIWLYAVPSATEPAPAPQAAPREVEEVPDLPPSGIKASRKDAEYTWVGIFDAHVPDHDRPTWRCCLRVIEDVQPDEILLVGDFLDVASMSSHAPLGHGGPTLSDEVAEGRKAIRELRAAAPKAHIIYLEGNHESRPGRLASQRLSQVHDLVQIDQLLGLREMGIEWLPEGRALKRGHLRFVHGFWSPEHHAAKHMRELGYPGVVYGHTHRPQMYSKAKADSEPRVAYGMPCMCALDPKWVRGKPTGWINGFGVGYVDETGDFSVYPVLAFNGRIRWGGKVYDGNL